MDDATARNAVPPGARDTPEPVMRALLERQRRAFMSDGEPPLDMRIDRIDRAIAMLVRNEARIVEAIDADFGCRSHTLTRMVDVMSPIGFLKHARANAARWMRPERKRASFPFNLLGGKAYVQYQPLGVVGVVAPWNAPLGVGLAGLGNIFAAGDRVMLKAPEQTPAISALLKQMLADAFDETEAAVVTGGPVTGAAFAALPFDHLLFTGATAVAPHILHAAADNLTPVTLELGGKCPVIVGRSNAVKDVAAKVMNGRLLNGGQVCFMPDYVLLPHERVEAFVAEARDAVAAMYPGLLDNGDFTATISDRHYDRLLSYLAEARTRGCRIVELNPAGEALPARGRRKQAPTLVIDPPPDLMLSREEVFGPILAVHPYDRIEQAIAFVNARPRPLALYYFGRDRSEMRRVLRSTWSGGVTVNDIGAHTAMQDLPFGGVGPSGMGRYIGYEGFRTFSNAKSVYEAGWLDLSAKLRPPYGGFMEKLLAGAIKR